MAIPSALTATYRRPPIIYDRGGHGSSYWESAGNLEVTAPRPEECTCSAIPDFLQDRLLDYYNRRCETLTRILNEGGDVGAELAEMQRKRDKQRASNRFSRQVHETQPEEEEDYRMPDGPPQGDKQVYWYHHPTGKNWLVNRFDPDYPTARVCYQHMDDVAGIVKEVLGSNILKSRNMVSTLNYQENDKFYNQAEWIRSHRIAYFGNVDRALFNPN